MTDKSARETLIDVMRGLGFDFDTPEAQAAFDMLDVAGFAVVPKEPTEAMHGALIVCNMVRGDVLNYLTGKPEAVRDIWRHMLAASNPKEEGR